MSESEIVSATEKLLAAASAGDVATYASLSAESLTAIEPETQGTVVTGLAFHKHMLNRNAISPYPTAMSHATWLMALAASQSDKARFGVCLCV